MEPNLALVFAFMTQILSLPPGLLSALCYTESKHVVYAINRNDGHDDSLGVCQVQPRTARHLGYTGVVQTLYVSSNINAFYAGLYLSHQLVRYRGNYECAIAAYNAGSCRMNARGQIKNRKYVAKVLAAWKEGR